MNNKYLYKGYGIIQNLVEFVNADSWNIFVAIYYKIYHMKNFKANRKTFY